MMNDGHFMVNDEERQAFYIVEEIHFLQSWNSMNVHEF
jgi:hypothetical protein